LSYLLLNECDLQKSIHTVDTLRLNIVNKIKEEKYEEAL